MASSLIKSLQNLSISPHLTTNNFSRVLINNIRCIHHVPVEKPKPGIKNKPYRRIVHYPENYTVKPLNVTNLGGRDPVTGRLVVKGIGGGIKHKYHWVDWKRVGPKEGAAQEERVIKIIKDGCRTANVALVAVGDQLKYILATENMKAGDIIRTSMVIPRIPVRPNEGDAYPLGALPIGTQIHCIEPQPGIGGFLVKAAGSFATIVRKSAETKRVIIAMPSKREFSIPEASMCTVGRLSNVEHSSTHVGSAQNMRAMGNRPRSGLWQRKTGRFGRKLRRPPPVKVLKKKEESTDEVLNLTYNGHFTKFVIPYFQY